MDVGLMLSKSEAFGRVTVEYMFNNLAVIASDTGANPELVNDRKTGYLYKLGDIASLADKMEQLINNRDLLMEMASNGYHYAIQTFPSEKNTTAVYELYQKVQNLHL